ncbi:hypothetical protein Nit79A3_1112 [Nitrosomonas sp. Is79A3]|uniref:hypothetical protein n=1 Tax=Nitrosomonas sp. (strain Is79A3) TaxID=261292 RepID=UPI000215C9D0
MKTIFFVFLLTLSLSNSAYATLNNVCSSGYSVFFGNGVNNDINKMDRSLDQVRLILGKNYNSEQIQYYKAQNDSNGLLLDLLTTFEQKMAEDPTLVWSMLLDFISGETVSHAIVNFLSDYFLGSQIDYTTQLKQNLAQFTQYSDSTLIGHVEAYTMQLTQGRKVMVVAHSQGNLYANAAYYRLASNPHIEIDAFGIAGVADPANEVAGGTPYVTSKNDMVINALRAIETATLPYNDSSVPINTNDLLGHGFEEIYTNSTYSAIRSHTTSVMNTTLSSLHTNVNNTNGPITATLTWDIPGDIDLHIYEPSSTHVYYASRQGLAGSLDRDDTTGTGPEHYYTSCSNVIPGTYSFGVNYYSGSGAKTATIQLNVLGEILPSRSIILPQSRGSGGNGSPSILFNVTLKKDLDGSYTYNLQ